MINLGLIYRVLFNHKYYKLNEIQQYEFSYSYSFVWKLLSNK